MISEEMRAEYIRRLKEMQREPDTEYAHNTADTVLCDILTELGFEDIVDEYESVDKWYA